MPSVENVFADIPSALPAELVQTLVSATHVRIERIVSMGHASPEGFWYDQDDPEWVMLLEGAARLRFEDESPPMELRAGDFVSIAAHRRHRVEWTAADETTIWLAVHFVQEQVNRGE